MSVQGGSEGSKAYRYNASITFGLSLATAVTWLLAMVGAAGADEYIWSLPIAVLLFIGAVFLTRACLSRATIVINNNGVAALFFGHRIRVIDWRNVKKIVKARIPVGYGYYSDRFQVYAEDHGIPCRFLLNICGNIAFDERIGGLRDLLDQINLRAREHAIPLLVWDLKAIAKQRPLIQPKGQRGRTELPVTEF